MFGGIPVSEVDNLAEYWNAFPNLRAELFKQNDTPYLQLSCDNIKSAICGSSDINRFEQAYQLAFDGFEDYLRTELIENAVSVKITQEETTISENIFSRLAGVQLVDKYEGYQLLDDEWVKIAVDLEIIQTEGFEAAKKVDPNIVIKKKDGKEQEVQEGWIGHIIPFELVQTTLLSEDHKALKDKETRLAEIPSEYEEILESMTEDEKQSCEEQLNEDNTAFVTKDIAKKIKALKSEPKSAETQELIIKLLQVEALSKEEKELKSQIKTETAALHAKTKTTIEELSDEQVKKLLEIKWIKSLVDNLYSIPDTIVSGLVAKIKSLAEKYNTTYFDIEAEISETEKELCSLIDELCGNEFDMKGLSEFKSLLLGE